MDITGIGNKKVCVSSAEILCINDQIFEKIFIYIYKPP